MMQKYKFSFATMVTLFCTLLVQSCSSPISTRADVSQSPNILNSSFDTLMKASHERGLFNGNVLVKKNGKIVYENSFGDVDASSSQALTRDSIFNIGSVSKQFSAVGIMILKERGKLTLEDRLSEYFPELPRWADDIQIKHLLNYTSGLPRVNWETIRNHEDAFEDIMKVEVLPFPPGEGFLYSNNNIFLQRLIITKVSGQSFEDFTKENILVPVGMTHSVFDPDSTTKDYVTAFNNENENDPAITFPITGWLCVTAEDISKWLKALSDEKLISASSLKTLLKADTPNSGRSALGNGRFKDGLITYHRHQGESRNFQASVSNNISEDLIIILLTNNKNDKLSEITEAIEAISKGEEFGIPKKPLAAALESDCMESIEACQASYNKLKNSSFDTYDFDNQAGLNELGYSVLGEGETKLAISIFKMNVAIFPTVANVYDSLGEAYLAEENYPLALLNYEKALELDSENENAANMITRIEQLIQAE